MSQGFLWWSSVRLRAPNTGNVDSMPGWGSKIPHATKQREGEKERSVPPPSSSKSRVCVSVCVLETEMATHSNILAWRIPWTEEPGGL